MRTIHRKGPVVIPSTRRMGGACPTRCGLCRHLKVQSILNTSLRPHPITLLTMHGPGQCVSRADVLQLLTCILLITCGSGGVGSNLGVTFTPRDVRDDRSIFIDLFNRLGVCASRNVLQRTSLGSPGVDHLLACLLVSNGGTRSSLRVTRTL